jgi:hypothetical protein
MIITEGQGTVNSGFKGSRQPIVQNLGPGDIHISTSSTDVATTGLYLPVGAVYEFPSTLIEGGGNLFIRVLTGHVSADVRIINVG